MRVSLNTQEHRTEKRVAMAWVGSCLRLVDKYIQNVFGEHFQRPIREVGILDPELNTYQAQIQPWVLEVDGL